MINWLCDKLVTKVTHLPILLLYYTNLVLRSYPIGIYVLSELLIFRYFCQYRYLI